MLVDRYEPEDVFSRVPHMAARIDPVLSKLDQLLDDDALYQQVRADFGKRYRYTLVHGRHSTPVEVRLAHAHRQASASVELSGNRRAGRPEPDPALVLSAVLGAGAR
jgi:IS5 family transposase